MAVQLNHLIVMARNQAESAKFFTEILGLPAATRFGPFLVVQTANGVSLDFDEAEDEITPLHYAFLISEIENSRKGTLLHCLVKFALEPLLCILHRGGFNCDDTRLCLRFRNGDYPHG